MTMDSVRDGVFHRLCRQFQQAFIANGAPDEMALFAQAEPTDGTRRLYFTPGCTAYVRPLIEGHGGKPCTMPDDDAITLVFGVPGAESVAFVAGGDGMRVDDIDFPTGVTPVPEVDAQPRVGRHVK